MDPILLSLNARRTLELRIPATDKRVNCSNTVETLSGLEAAAAALRRAVCARAAAGRNGTIGSDDEDLLEDDDDDDGLHAHCLIRVQTLPVAQSIGGKLWDASLLMSAWLAGSVVDLVPPASAAGARRPLVLEVGAGLGVVGLALAKQCPWLHVTLSDYDTEIVENLERNAALNFASPRPEHTLDVAALDFRDFTPASIDKAPLPQCLQQHADAGLYGQVDLLLGADVVYEKTHCQLAHVCLALLAPHTDERRPLPCAVFFSNISRPYIRDFVEGLDAAGLSCRIERVTPSEALARRLRRTHEGWGVGAIFCMFHVTRRPPVAVEVD